MVNELEQLVKGIYEYGFDKYGMDIITDSNFLEILAAEKLGHQWNTEKYGGDAWDADGNPVEYKNTSINNPGGTFHTDYNVEKYTKIKDFYILVRDNGIVTHVYKGKSSSIIDKLRSTKSERWRLTITPKNIEKYNLEKIKL